MVKNIDTSHLFQKHEVRPFKRNTAAHNDQNINNRWIYTDWQPKQGYPHKIQDQQDIGSRLGQFWSWVPWGGAIIFRVATSTMPSHLMQTHSSVHCPLLAYQWVLTRQYSYTLSGFPMATC